MPCSPAAVRFEMPDTGRVLLHSSDSDDPEPVDVYTPQTSISCGMNHNSKPLRPSEIADGSARTLRSFSLLVPLGTTIGSADRFEVTHRAGWLLVTSELYGVVGILETETCIEIEAEVIRSKSRK